MTLILQALETPSFHKDILLIAKTYTCSLLGIDALLVEVEVDLSPGLPYFATVGLPDNIVRESKDRVKTALQNSGKMIPWQVVTIATDGSILE